MVKFRPKFNPWSSTNTVAFFPVGEGIGPGELKLASEPTSPWFGAKLNGHKRSFDLIIGNRRAEVKKFSWVSFVKKDGTRTPRFVFRTAADGRALAGILHRIASVIWYIIDNDGAPSELVRMAQEVLHRSERGEISSDLIHQFREMFYPIVEVKIQRWFDEMSESFIPSRILSEKDELIFVDENLGWSAIPSSQFDRCFQFYRISQGLIQLKWVAEPTAEIT
jgi:hypothetical protein